MTEDAVKERLEGVSDEERAKAQARLNKICEEYGLSPINLKHGKGQWRELCYRMIGLPHTETDSKSSGRKTKFTDDEVRDIVQHIYVETKFENLDEKKHLRKKKTILDAAKELTDRYDLEPEKYNHTNKTNIKNTIKNLTNVRYKKLLKKQGEEDFEIDTPYDGGHLSKNKKKKK